MKLKRFFGVFFLLSLFPLSSSIAGAPQAKEFRIQAGALVEFIYFDVEPKDAKKLERNLINLKSEIENSGGEHLADFKVLLDKGYKHPVTHLTMVQWPDVQTRENLLSTNLFLSLKKYINDSGFFGVQQETPIRLERNKMYDFTNAWTVAKSPDQMQVVQHVLNTYFGKIFSLMQEYQVSTKSFFAQHPAAVSLGKFYNPQIVGMFEWQSLNDPNVFGSDPSFLEHVDIRDSILIHKGGLSQDERNNSHPEDTFYTELLN